MDSRCEWCGRLDCPLLAGKARFIAARADEQSTVEQINAAHVAWGEAQHACHSLPRVNWYKEALRLSALLDAPEAGGVLASVEGEVINILPHLKLARIEAPIGGETLWQPWPGASIGQRVTIEVRAVATGEPCAEGESGVRR